MGTSNRREFLKKAAAGSASVAANLALTGLFPRRTFAESQSGFNRVAYRRLGSTGFKTSEVGFGCMNMSNPDLIHAAIDYGINYIDTAHGYMNGRNEEIVGQVMKTKRDKVFLTTKIKWGNPKAIPDMMETSIKRLQTDHVDLMLLHVCNSKKEILNEDFMKMFDDARKKGLTRFVGVSTHSNQAEVMDAAVESKFWEAVLTGYNYFSPPEVKASIEKTRKAGLAVIGMKTLLNPSTWPWQPLKDIRKDKNGKVNASQALLKWVLDDMYVDTIIPGITTFEQLADDVAIMSLPMSFGERHTIYKYGERLKGHYCRGVAGCTGCLDQCPKGVKVSDLNRCLMYADGYGDPALARENYNELPESSRVDICSECDECVVTCKNGLDLTENINRAKELFAKEMTV